MGKASKKKGKKKAAPAPAPPQGQAGPAAAAAAKPKKEKPSQRERLPDDGKMIFGGASLSEREQNVLARDPQTGTPVLLHGCAACGKIGAKLRCGRCRGTHVRIGRDAHLNFSHFHLRTIRYCDAKCQAGTQPPAARVRLSGPVSAGVLTSSCRIVLQRIGRRFTSRSASP